MRLQQKILLLRSSRSQIFIKKVFLRVSSNLPESIFHDVLGFQPAPLLKKKPQHRCFYINFTGFLRTPFSQLPLERLILNLQAEQYLKISNIFEGNI